MGILLTDEDTHSSLHVCYIRNKPLCVCCCYGKLINSEIQKVFRPLYCVVYLNGFTLNSLVHNDEVKMFLEMSENFFTKVSFTVELRMVARCIVSALVTSGQKPSREVSLRERTWSWRCERTQHSLENTSKQSVIRAVKESLIKQIYCVS